MAYNFTKLRAGDTIASSGAFGFKRLSPTNESGMILSTRLPVPCQGVSSATVGTKVYLFGGYNGAALDQICVFDTMTKEVATLSTVLPYARYDFASHTFNDRIYLFDPGEGKQPIEDTYIFRFDPSDNGLLKYLTFTWNFRKGELVGNSAFLFCGMLEGSVGEYTFGGQVNEIYRSCLKNEFTGFASAAVEDKIYLFGGSKSTRQIQVFDTTTKKASVLDGVKIASRYPAGAVAAGKKIFLFGGMSDTSTNALNIIQVFDTVTNSIETLSDTLPIPLHSCAAERVVDTVYLFGGYSNGYLDSIIEYHLP